MHDYTTDIAVFSTQLPSEGRLAGLDVGSKTIGLAISDGLRMVATGRETIIRSKLSKELNKLLEIKSQESIQGWVIGYPVNMDGSEGPRCQSMRQFARHLYKAMQQPILLWDERMSSVAVERTMLEADMSRQRRSELVDKLAAAYFLQGSLDALRACK